MTQQPPPNQQGGYYHSQYSQQPSYPEPSYPEPSYPEPSYPEPSYPEQQPPYPQQQPSYPQQPAYPQQQPAYPQQAPQYPQQYPQQSVSSEPQAPYSPQPYEPAPYSSQPYSSQPYSSQPYPPQPYSPQPQPGYGGQPPYGGQPGYFPGAGAPQPPPKRSKRVWVILGSIAGGVVLLGGVAVARTVLGDAANEVQLNLQVPEVGECITEASTLPNSETEVVACDSADAAYEVVGNDGTWVESDFWNTPAEEMCTGFDTTEQMLWIGEITDDQSGDGEVVCLASVAAE